MPKLKMSNVAKTYDPGLFKRKVQALSDLSFEVEEGEVFGLIGPNGAGKSTAIRLMLGLTRPDAGRIFFGDKPVSQASRQDDAGYLPENPYLYDHLTLRELLFFAASVSGMDAGARDRRIEELLEKVDLTGSVDRRLRTFSKGMLQRAGICFALLHDPDVAILDEPMSGLDPIGRKMVFDLIMELREQGKTIFFCSHILSDVERLCDRIGILVDGRMVREFSREQFEQQRHLPIHLVLDPLQGARRDVFHDLPGELQEGFEETVLSVSPASLNEVVDRLSREGISITATRSERVSLEDLFLQVVKEGRS